MSGFLPVGRRYHNRRPVALSRGVTWRREQLFPSHWRSPGLVT
jgi:hypothetical protein